MRTGPHLWGFFYARGQETKSMADYEGKTDTRHLAKVRAAEDRSISEPGSSPAISPPAQRQVSIITPARSANKTHCPVSKR